MNEKIMGLIELAMQFKGFEKVANVEFASHVNGVSVFVLNGSKYTYRKVCYLDYDNAEERLDEMKKDLEKMLKENKAA